MPNSRLAKNQTLAMAHGGLGLVYFRRGKYDDAIPEFEESTKVDPSPEADPVTFYVLAIADEKTSHFDAAVAAFNKCAASPRQLAADVQERRRRGKEAGRHAVERTEVSDSWRVVRRTAQGNDTK